MNFRKLLENENWDLKILKDEKMWSPNKIFLKTHFFFKACMKIDGERGTWVSRVAHQRWPHARDCLNQTHSITATSFQQWWKAHFRKLQPTHNDTLVFSQPNDNRVLPVVSLYEEKWEQSCSTRMLKLVAANMMLHINDSPSPPKISKSPSCEVHCRTPPRPRTTIWNWRTPTSLPSCRPWILP